MDVPCTNKDGVGGDKVEKLDMDEALKRISKFIESPECDDSLKRYLKFTLELCCTGRGRSHNNRNGH